MKVLLRLEPELRLNLLVLFAAGLCFWAGLAGLLPTLPLYIESLGADGQQIGIVMAFFAVGLLLSRPSLSRMADYQGRKVVLVIGMVAIALAPIGYLVVQVVPPVSLGPFNLPLLLMMLFRACHGISIAAFATAYSALIVDLSPPQKRGEVIGYMSLVNPLGMALGPAIGGFLQEGFGAEEVFIAAMALGSVGLLCTSRVTEPQRIASLSGPSPASNLFWRLLFIPRVRIPAFILLLVGLAFGALSTFVPLLIREANVSLNVGLVYTASAIASFAIRLVVGPASDRHGRGRFITLSLGFYAASMFLLGRAQTPTMFLVAGLVQGAGAGTLIPMMAALMADRSHPEERGRMFGLCLTGFDIGIAVAGPILGWVADLTSYRAIFPLAGILSLVGMVVFVTASSQDLPHSLRFALGSGRDVYAVGIANSSPKS